MLFFALMFYLTQISENHRCSVSLLVPAYRTHSSWASFWTTCASTAFLFAFSVSMKALLKTKMIEFSILSFVCLERNRWKNWHLVHPRFTPFNAVMISSFGIKNLKIIFLKLFLLLHFLEFKKNKKNFKEASLSFSDWFNSISF